MSELNNQKANQQKTHEKNAQNNNSHSEKYLNPNKTYDNQLKILKQDEEKVKKKQQQQKMPKQSLISIQQLKIVQKQKAKDQPKLDNKKLQIKAQLQSMQFQTQDILQAIQKTSTLDQAIEFIINKLQLFDQNNLKQHLSNQVTLFFIVRMDLKMGTGKIAAQVGHAALRAFQNMRYSSSNSDKNANLLIQWMQKGQKNKILQAQTQYQIRNYLQNASQKFINNCYIRDAGRTQIAAGSMTVAAIGPIQQSEVDFLSHLTPL